ncbi:hypothetical protein JX266_004154 [Neoarthrinium moseri]|nr:hypothetical protein JX266_004154 [Neoarthrinium moseri]
MSESETVFPTLSLTITATTDTSTNPVVETLTTPTATSSTTWQTTTSSSDISTTSVIESINQSSGSHETEETNVVTSPIVSSTISSPVTAITAPSESSTTIQTENPTFVASSVGESSEATIDSSTSAFLPTMSLTASPSSDITNEATHTDSSASASTTASVSALGTTSETSSAIMTPSPLPTTITDTVEASSTLELESQTSSSSVSGMASTTNNTNIVTGGSGTSAATSSSIPGKDPPLSTSKLDSPSSSITSTSAGSLSSSKFVTTSGNKDTIKPADQSQTLPPSSITGSSTLATESTTSATTTNALATFTVTSTEVKRFASIFDSEDVAPGTAALVYLEIHDPETGEVIDVVVYVVEYIGCFGIPADQNPFGGVNATDRFRNNQDAGDKASTCAGYCAGDGESLSANNQGACFCGEQISTTEPGQDRDNCEARCRGDASERCGGGALSRKRSLRRAAETYINVILAKPASEVVIIVQKNETETSTGFTSPIAIPFTSSTGYRTTAEASSISNSISKQNSVESTQVSAFSNGALSTSIQSPATEISGGTSLVISETSTTTTSINSIIPSGTSSQITPLTASSGAKISPTIRPSSTSTESVTGSSTPPSTIDMMDPIILGVTPIDDTFVSKRNANLINNLAATEGFGELMSGGELLAATPGVPIMPFRVSPQGSITRVFSLLADATLSWTNVEFVGGRASFCRDHDDGLVYIILDAHLVPNGCTRVNLVAYLATQCQDNEITPSPTVDHTTATTATAATDNTDIGLEIMTSLPFIPENIFTRGAFVTGEGCVMTNLSWVPGQPTFINLGFMDCMTTSDRKAATLTGSWCGTCSNMFTPDGLKSLWSDEGYSHLNASYCRQSATNCTLCQVIWKAAKALFQRADPSPLIFKASCQRATPALVASAAAQPHPLSLDTLTANAWSEEQGRYFLGVCEIAAFTYEGDSLNEYFPARPPILDSMTSDLVIDAARRWFKDCRANHPDCGPSEQPPILPTRVLRVDYGGGEDSIQLHISGKGQRGDYLALSYSWGGPQPLTTMTHNIDALVGGISLSQFPRTLRDAIIVTRELGFQYLWIDALCILQDSLEDKAYEIQRMGKIYKNATATIIAASSKAAGDGFLQWKTETKFCCQQQLTGPNGRPGHIYLTPLQSTSFHTQPLSHRAWAFQEYLLSSRHLYYTDKELVWQCRSLSLETIRPNIVQYPSRASRVPFGIFHAAESSDAHLTTEGQKNFWHHILTDYTRRALTDPEDRLNAITGVTQELSELWSDECVFGLWKSRFIEELAWTVSWAGDFEARSDRAPTWSWVSMPPTVQIASGRFDSEPDAILVSLSINKKCAVVQGRTLTSAQAQLVLDDGIYQKEQPWGYIETDLEETKATSQSLLLLLGYDADVAYALVLGRVDETQYMRLGLGVFEQVSEEVTALWAQAEMKEIMLV